MGTISEDHGVDVQLVVGDGEVCAVLEGVNVMAFDSGAVGSIGSST